MMTMYSRWGPVWQRGDVRDGRPESGGPAHEPGPGGRCAQPGQLGTPRGPPGAGPHLIFC